MSKFSTFFLVKTLNNSCNLSKMKQHTLNLEPKLPYLGILKI